MPNRPKPNIVKTCFSIAIACTVISLAANSLSSQPLAAQDPEPERLELSVEAPERLEVGTVCVVKVSTNAKHIRVRVRGSLFDEKPVYEHRNPGEYGWTATAGEYAVEVDIFDPEMGISGQVVKVEFTGDGGGPIDPQDPIIPVDEFDNIGRDAFAWARELELDKTNPAADNYEQAAAKLLGEERPELRNIEAGVEWLSRANEPLELEGNWTEWGIRVNERWQTSGVDDRFSAGRFFRAVANGLGAVE